jgi:hypothetical protein
MAFNLGDFISDFLDALVGLRKFIAFVGIFIVSIVFRCKGLIDGGQVTDLLKNTFLAFCGTNSIEHFSLMIRDHLASKLPPNLAKKLTAGDTDASST